MQFGTAKQAFPLAPIRLLLVDVDGTLVGHDLKVRPRVERAIAAVRARGVHVALCTGRPAYGTRDYVQGLNLTGWHIFDSGATISDPLAGSVLWQQTVERSLAQRVLAAAHRSLRGGRLLCRG
jgi:HAD superfamily hydrolase (TIGR01484 family)